MRSFPKVNAALIVISFLGWRRIQFAYASPSPNQFVVSVDPAHAGHLDAAAELAEQQA